MKRIKNLMDFGFETKNRTFVIAEAGINHGGDLETAKRMIESAKKTGCDVIKFQTYITEKRTFKGSPIFDILKKCELSLDSFKDLKKCADDEGIKFFSTPFDDESVDCLVNLNCDLYKIASFDMKNYAFLTKVASTKKPVILSTGMSNLDEISEAYATMKKQTDKIALLHCVSSYPTPPELSNLSSLYVLSEKFDCVIGHSDHTDGIEVPLLAVAAGAQIIEKHFKISAKMDCVDASVSITENQMRSLVSQVRYIESIFGEEKKELMDLEKGCLVFRR